MPRLGIQLPSSTNWKPPPTLNSAVMNNERTKDDNEAPNAMPFNNVSLALEVKRMMIPPTRGRKMIILDRKSTRLNSSHLVISYAVFCLKKKNNNKDEETEHIHQ